MITSLSGCSKNSLYGYFVGPDAPSGAITTIDNNQALKANDYYLSFEKKEDKTFGVTFKNINDKKLIAYNDTPACISVRGKETFNNYSVGEYSRGYDSVKKTNYGYHCVSILKTSGKSEFRLMDSYYLSQSQGFSLNRKVSVIRAKNKDVGFESLYKLKNGENSTNVDDFDFFIPSVLYKDAKYNDVSALITSLYNPRVYVKETRMGLPMTMIKNKNSQYYYSIVHAEPNISVNGILGGGGDGATNDGLEYGSLGFESETKNTPSDVTIGFCYPCAEGPATFDSGAGWSRRFHEVKDNHYHEYKLGLVFGASDDFNDALVSSYERAYPFVEETCETIDNEMIYQQNIDCFTSEYSEVDKGEYVSAGIPWEINLDGTDTKRVYSLQMGFVGQQTSVGAHLYRQGLIKDNDDYIHQGKTIVDFWTSSKIYPSDQVFPYIWWEQSYCSYHASGKQDYAAIYLRMLCDGVEGILDAYQYGLESGEDNEDWKNYCIRFTDNLVAHQNEDGSFNRAFTKDGDIPDSSFADKNIGYDSSDPAKFKVNTPIAIRLLTRMYNLTQDEDYKASAIKAAEYSYENIYKELGKYVGGTCDNANVVDKEAAIYAMYGFKAAYELTLDEKYLKATKHAACCSLSWTFMYNFACPANDEHEATCPYYKGNTMGASIIATGHAGADCFSCAIWFDIYRIYDLTGIEVYKNIAITLQNAVKKLSDYTGERGWAHPCLMAEACQISDFLYHPTTKDGSTVWLAWCGVVQINPIAYTYQTYGVYQLENVGVK